MAKVRDRAEDFKDAVRATALSIGYPEAKLAETLASFIIHKHLQRSPFIRASLKTLESINELEHFIVKHRKDYVDLHRTTEEERDNIEHEVSNFIKACKDQIDILKTRIYDEEPNGNAKWLQLRNDSSNPDAIAHKHGVVLILSEQLHSVTAQFDRLRSVRFQDAVIRAMPRRKMNMIPDAKSSVPCTSDLAELEQDLPSISDPVRVQNQLLDEETRALQVELTSLLDAVQGTESKMVEMSALNHLMSTHVLQQAQQIEYLYEQAVEATKNVEQGNKELSSAIQRNSSSRPFLLLFLFIVTFSTLFLDWYS